MATENSKLLEKIAAMNLNLSESDEMSGFFSSTKSDLSFSMYGNFTPITVRSSSIAKDADLERNR